MAVQLPRQDSVVLETLDLTKNEEKNDEMFDQPPPAEDNLYSPSWHPGTLPGEAMIIYELNVAMELTSSVQATWLNNVAYVNNEMITPKKSGVLIGTNFRLIYVDKVDKPHNFPIAKNINLIPFNAIGNITFLITGKDESTSRTLLLWCKDWRLITLTFESPATCSEMHKKLIERTVWLSIDNVFAFTQSASTYPPDMEHIMEFDFKRMQLDPSKWRLSKANHDYSQIPTYPSTLIVPNSVSDAVMLKAGNFRCNARIPAVCWVSPTGTSISRTSQPRSGFFAKSEDDEMLVKGIFSNNQQYANKTMYILDCRPRLSAVGNMAKGMGYEKPEGYSEHCCEIMWMGIDNIHAMRDSLRNMYKLCLGSQSDHKWLSNWEYTKWPDHLNFVLSSAVKMVELIQQGSSVLVHCSDGWDRTPQMTSLAQLLLDPYYRTIEGFLALITKEWISFGHQFQIRVGHGCSDFWNTDHCSPIFFQWIDCVWQVMQQFPHCFEFNSKFLIDLLDNLYNCYFFEFLFNSEREMMQAKRCTSLWERYLKRPDNFVNPFYHETNQPRVLYPDSSPKRLQFWAGYYLRYYNPKEEGMHYIEQKGREIIAVRDQLADQLVQLKLQLEKEQAMRNQLEKQWNLAMNAEKEKDDIRRRSFECKVLSEGESTVWCKIGMDDMVTPPLKRIHIIDDYNPSNNHSFIGIENANQDANHEELPVSPKRKNSRVDVHPMEVIEDPP